MRVGIVTARVLAFALGLPLHGVCSLDVLAAQHAAAPYGSEGSVAQFLVATDARRKEVYWAHYDGAGHRLAGPFGIAVGIGLVKIVPAVVNHFDSSQTYRMVVAMWSVVGSFVVSGLIGIGFGLYPAMKAARMSPIEALRHE